MKEWVFLCLFTCNCGHLFFISHQKFCCTVVSGNLSINFLYFYIKFHFIISHVFFLSFFLNQKPYHFITWCIGHLKNTSSLHYGDLPNVDYFHFSKRNSLVSPLISTKKVFKSWQVVKLMVVNVTFSRILMFLEWTSL